MDETAHTSDDLRDEAEDHVQLLAHHIEDYDGSKD